MNTKQVTDHEVLSSSIDGRVRRYDLRLGRLFTDYIGAAVTCAKFTKDGQCVLISTHDNTLRLLDITTGEMLGELCNGFLVWSKLFMHIQYQQLKKVDIAYTSIIHDF